MKKAPLRPGEIRVTAPDNRLHEMAPYTNSVETFRPWFKRLHKDKGSLRRCAGVNDFFSTGITIPAWTNIDFKPGENGRWATRSAGLSFMNVEYDLTAVEGFEYFSTGECPVSNMRSDSMKAAQYPKLLNPWKVETARGWSCLLLPTMWEPNENYTVLPAMVHTDFYHTANIVLNITTDKPFTIKWGTPLAHLIPIERKHQVHGITINDESMFKYVASRGFGMGHITPWDSTAAPYRRERIKIDKDIEEESHSLIKRIMGRK